MSRPMFKRLFHSVFTKLLVIILAAGFAITLTLVIGFSVIRFQAVGHLDRNLIFYAEYLIRDLGDPPDVGKAGQIAERTGMAIRYDANGDGWQTDAFPVSLPLERARVRRQADGIWIGHLRGHTFIKIDHAGGHLVFISPHWANTHANVWQVFAAMAVAFFAVLATAYFFIRRVLRPLQPLKAGVDALGDGRLDYRVPQTGQDEFRELSEAFNTMAGRLSTLLENKEQLLLDVSHELRSPLTRLNVQVEMLRDEGIRHNLKADVKEMQAMVSTILEAARLRNTVTALQIEQTDMTRLIRSVADDFDLYQPGVVCKLHKPVLLAVDREKMRMVIRNLIENAVKNTPADGQAVAVDMVRGDNRLEITVEDKGIGIAESDLPRLFEPFYRTDASRSRKTGGYGLGLSLCKAVVDAHNGTIAISSTPGKGTRVVVSLPIN